MNETLLKRKRKQKKATQKDVADIVGIHENTYLLIERGKMNPSVATAIKIARFLGLSVEVLFADFVKEE